MSIVVKNRWDGEAMKLDDLAKLEGAATPAPWAIMRRWFGQCYVDIDSSANVVAEGCPECQICAMKVEDAVLMVELRNRAPALIECARLLQELREAAKTVDETRSGGAVWLLRVSPELFVKTAEALARLEGTTK